MNRYKIVWIERHIIEVNADTLAEAEETELNSTPDTYHDSHIESCTPISD